jgi:hypothetical protein
MNDESTTPIDEEQVEEPRPKAPDEWRRWPPSAKVQIVLIAAGFGLLNFILLGIWALVMMDRFG